MTDKDSVEIFVSEKPPFLVISFVGGMATPMDATKIETCMAELSDRQEIYCVLNFHDVSEVDTNCIPPLVKLQKVLRDRGAVRLCFLKPEVKKILVAKGAIRENELNDNLKSALDNLKGEHMRKTGSSK